MTTELLLSSLASFGASFFKDFVSSNAQDKLENRISESIDDYKLKQRLSTFIEGNRKYHSLSNSIDDEFDLEGLLHYISIELRSDCEQRFFNPNQKKRKQANDVIISKAIAFASPSTPEAEGRVKYIVTLVLSLIANFYKESIKPSDYILATEIVDSTVDATLYGTRKIGKEIAKDSTNTVVENNDKNTHEILNKLDNIEQHINTLQAADLIPQCSNPFDQRTLDNYLNTLSKRHPLNGYYGVTTNHGKLQSIPLSKEALKLYPPSLKFRGPVYRNVVKDDGTVIRKYFNDEHVNPITYSHNHQVPIIMDITAIEKFLGDVPDPIQAGVEDMVGEQVVFKPEPLSKVFLIDVKVTQVKNDDEIEELKKAKENHTVYNHNTITYYRGLHFRIQEKLDDGSIVIGNKDANDPISLSIKMTPKEGDVGTDGSVATASANSSENNGIKTAQSDFKIHLNEGCTNEDMLTFVKFMKMISLSEGESSKTEQQSVHSNKSSQEDRSGRKDNHSKVRRIIRIYSSELQEDLVAGEIDTSNYTSRFKTVDDEIAFLKDVCTVEDFFDVNLDVRGDLYQKDINLTHYLAELTKGKVKNTWNEVTSTGIIDESFRTGWGAMINGSNPIDHNTVVDDRLGPYLFSFVSICNVELFGAKFRFNRRQTLHDCYIADIEKLRKKIAVLDNGDQIKIKMVAGTDNAECDDEFFYEGQDIEIIE